ncbi:hypothetical protein AB0L17_05385 [Streptomyces cellulosae]
MDALIREAQDELLAPLGPAERDELTRLLTALADHHGPAHPGPGEQS